MSNLRRMGIWAANGAPDNAEQMYFWRPGAVCCFQDYLGPNRVREYKQAHPEATVIVRFQHPKNWRDDLPQSARNVASELLAKWPEIEDFTDYVYFWNEINLHYENGDADPGHQWQYETREFYEQVADWTLQIADRVKSVRPEYPLVCPPFAAGHHEDGAPDDNGNPKEPWAGYDCLAPTIESHFGGVVCTHNYWGNAGGSMRDWLHDSEQSSWYAFRWRRVLKLFGARYGMPGTRVIIDEAGNFGASDPDFTDQVIYYSEQTLMDPRVIALCFFLWQDPTNSPGNLPNSWVQRCQNLSQHVARLTAMPDVVMAVQPVPAIETIRLKLSATGEVVVLPIEEYLRGVVGAEMPALWHPQAVRAQAVLARSYALACKERRADKAYDVDDTTRFQAYAPSRIHPASDAVIRDTAGIYLMQDGHAYFAEYKKLCGRADCPFCNGTPGSKNANNPSGVWPNNACQYGMKLLAESGRSWRAIALYYYPQGVSLSDATQ